MNWFLLLISFLLPSSIQASQGHLKLTHLNGGVYLVEDHYWSKENSAVYIGKKSVTIISSTWTPQTAEILHQKILALTKKPIETVINTNFHPDRAGGNSYFKKLGAKIISSQITKSLMNDLWVTKVRQVKKYFPKYPLLPVVLPDITFEKEFLIHAGRVKVLYLGPSHTEGGAVVYFPKEKILYASCILKEKLGNLSDANLDEYPKTVEKFKELDIKTIIAGHWSPLHGPELIDKYLTLLNQEVYKKPKKEIPPKPNPSWL